MLNYREKSDLGRFPQRKIQAEWRKVMKSPSRTCWETGQPYNGLGAWLQYNRRSVGA